MSTFLKKGITTLVIAGLLLPGVAFLAPKKAYAAGDVVGCAVGALGIGVGVGAVVSKLGLAVPTNDAVNNLNQTTRTTKECVLDGVTVLLREVLIASITRSIVNWINSGFQGGPSFVTNLEGFLADVVDQTVGEFINSTDLAFLCSPFQAQIKIYLASYQSSVRPPSCTLTGITQNIQSFFSGNFTSGGWPAFFEVATKSSNNPLFGLFDAELLLQRRIASNQQNRIKLLDWGKGFNPFEICDEDPGVARTPGGAPRNSPLTGQCRTVTPGDFINHHLNRVTESSIGRLELADELNEIIGALARQLLTQVLTGAGGLLGASQPSSRYGGQSYVDALYQETAGDAEQGIREVGLAAIDALIVYETDFIIAKEETLSRLEESEDNLAELYACFFDKANSPQNPPLSAADQETARLGAENATSTITSSITPLKTLVDRDISQAEANIEILLELEAKLIDADSVFDVEEIVSEELEPLIENGTTHVDGDVAQAEQQTEDVTELMNGLDAQTEIKLEECRELGSATTAP